MDKIQEVFASDKLLHFWPTKDQSFKDNTEASIRFILYASVAIYLFHGDYRYVYLGLAVVAILLYTVEQSPESYTLPGIPNVQVANLERSYTAPPLGEVDWKKLTHPNPEPVTDCQLNDPRPQCNINVRVQDFPNRRATG